jgi:4,5-DOPA dioxygenase extradiol
MDTRSLPPLFLSHGSPMIALEDSPAARFLGQLARVIDSTFGRPRAALVVSPHTATRQPLALAGARHEAIHDFGGFPRELYEMRYDAAGDPALAAAAAAHLRTAGIATEAPDAAGLDHGIWTLLYRMWPDASVPVVPLSLVPNWTPERQWAIGEALAPLADEGVLVIGSGAFTHNLRRFFGSGAQPGDAEVADVAAFRQWVLERSTARDWPALLDYRRQAPEAALQHPTDEHWLPFYVAGGAGGGTAVPQRVHGSVDHGVLAMDGYAFGPQAGRLAEALAAQADASGSGAARH